MRHSAGFSLVEMLVAIGLVGVLSGVLLGWLVRNQHSALERLTRQRNAQEIVSLGVCATMSGADFVIAGDKRATVLNLIAGTTGKTGAWKDRSFRLDNLKPEDLAGAIEFVRFEADLLLYEPAGGQM